MPRRIAFGLLTALAAASLLALFFRPLILSDFDAFPGDLGDALLNLYTLEHWYRWIALGQGHWLASSAFFPVDNTLGYTDALFLFAIPFGLARHAGMPPVAAYQLTLVVALTVGFAAFYHLLRREFRLARIPSLVGCTLAVVNTGLYHSAGHTQLFAVGLVPLLLILLVRFYRSANARPSRRVAWGASAALFLPALLYTGYYVAWFSVFFLLLLAATWLVYDQLAAGGRGRSECTAWCANHRLEAAGYALLLALGSVPFVLTYLPVLKEAGPRPFDEVLAMLPRWYDFVNVGRGHALWGGWWTRTFPEADARPHAWELAKGIPLITLALFVVSAVQLLRSLRRGEAAVAVPAGADAGGRTPGSPTLLAALVALALILACALQLRVADASAWWIVYHAAPGATAIRAVFRIQHVLAFALGFVVAVALDRGSAGHGRFGYLAPLWNSSLGHAVLLALIVIDQVNGDVAYGGSREQVEAMIARIPPPPAECRTFFVTVAPADRSPGPVINTVAAIIAQRLGVPTVNGYTSSPPPGWTLADPHSHAYLADVVAWLDANDIRRGACRLDLAAAHWTPLDSGQIALPLRLAAPLADSDFRVDFEMVDEVTTMAAGELRTVQVVVRNRGAATLSGVGSADGTFAIRLSYRWTDADGHSAGFNARQSLPAPIEPGGALPVTFDLTAPPVAGRYALQLDLVQERVAWFRDKGAEPFLRLVDVRPPQAARP